MTHLVLLGDSIFDNESYVPGHPAVIQQLNAHLEPTNEATLLAVDGDVTEDVATQLANLPTDATHLVISVGGNDALQASGVLSAPSSNILGELLNSYQQFIGDYEKMIQSVFSKNLPTTICTIYDSVPDLPEEAVMALSIYNDIIIRTAMSYGLPLIDLRIVCSEAEDYSSLSPIEPSHIGGEKIAKTIHEVVTQHDFAARRMVGYVGSSPQ